MAKTYGDRYENVNRDIGGGGQGVIRRVRDLNDPLKTEYALKRLKDKERCSRFKQEIDALKAINHRNVIPIIDDSGDPAIGVTDHKYWFVMPIASGNLESRVGIYKGNLDAVLKVAIQLSSALEAAHSKEIIHRDVKPANILFQKMDHEVWLSDFGICHFATAKDRLTPDGEVVGPRGFIAPELEPGGPVTITVAADLYSLGKVIYFMFSGGSYIAREELDSSQYNAHFEKGQQPGLLRNLLSQLIAPLDRRIDSASELTKRLIAIQKWEETARDLSLDATTLQVIDQMQKNAIKQRQILANNKAIQQSEERIVTETSNSIAAWLKGELEKIGAHIKQADTHQVEVIAIKMSEDNSVHFVSGFHTHYVARIGYSLSIEDLVHGFPNKFVLSIYVCQVTGGMRISIPGAAQPREATDPKLAVVPRIFLLSPPDYRKGMGGFIKSKAALARLQMDAQRRGSRTHGQDNIVIAKTFIGEQVNLISTFHAPEWPEKLPDVQQVLNEAVRTLMEYSLGSFHAVGP